MANGNKRKRVALDVDGVILNFTEFYLNTVRAVTGIKIPEGWAPQQWDLSKELNLSAADTKAVWRLINSPGMETLINPFPGAVAGVKKLAEVADVFFVTAPMESSPTWCYDRTNHLTELFGKELVDSLTYTSHKYTFAADVLVDDKPESCKEWEAAWPRGKALLWSAGRDMPLDTSISSVHSWEDVILRLDRLPDSEYRSVVR